VEHIAGVEDYQVALAAYRAACERWPGTAVTLRQGARVSEDSRRRIADDCAWPDLTRAAKAGVRGRKGGDHERRAAIFAGSRAGTNNSLKSVVVRVVRADVHPLIAVPNYAGVRVVSGIVVGISRRETQTCACYERHKAPTSKAGHTKTPADGGGANPWGYRGRAEPGTNRACAEPRANRGRAEPGTKRCAVAASAWLNSPTSLAFCPAVMPMPVSETANSTKLHFTNALTNALPHP
jgi:hypothetical protein